MRLDLPPPEGLDITKRLFKFLSIKKVSRIPNICNLLEKAEELNALKFGDFT